MQEVRGFVLATGAHPVPVSERQAATAPAAVAQEAEEVILVGHPLLAADAPHVFELSRAASSSSAQKAARVALLRGPGAFSRCQLRLAAVKYFRLPVQLVLPGLDALYLEIHDVRGGCVAEPHADMVFASRDCRLPGAQLFFFFSHRRCQAGHGIGQTTFHGSGQATRLAMSGLAARQTTRR